MVYRSLQTQENAAFRHNLNAEYAHEISKNAYKF